MTVAAKVVSVFTLVNRRVQASLETNWAFKNIFQFHHPRRKRLFSIFQEEVLESIHGLSLGAKLVRDDRLVQRLFQRIR